MKKISKCCVWMFSSMWTSSSMSGFNFLPARAIFRCGILYLFISCNLNSLLQRDNIRNQRENVILTIANAQSRLGFPDEHDPVRTLSGLCI